MALVHAGWPVANSREGTSVSKISGLSIQNAFRDVVWDVMVSIRPNLMDSLLLLSEFGHFCLSWCDLRLDFVDFRLIPLD